ncbi:hypothetical protein BDP27DRAFT_426350 [Rhodocollybia butyracea]|uniref:RING-type domain-containing protein n=1 Tax=Rhodocollybia butyracea TaxID=206335 RepID=A0A9P5UAR3_9AGAR|nr:hypothetical protein BDP27DRAFT_426350 [Rhodocollybia butyracea]
MELTLNTDLAMVEYCEHKFCRECFLQYLLSKIRDRRFPIACPTCMSDKSHADPSIIEYSLIEQMNIPEKDFQILEELMLSSHGTPVHCIRCSRTTLMDREEYQECTVVTCPLPDCVHSWCKKCSQTIDTDVPGTPKHSCDGTNEFESLMREKGWKACPGCNTNFQKIEGCNHMTCLSPGCNMHFCYRCGQAIVQSVIGREIDDAMKEHYGSCQLFEVEDDLD